MHAGSALPALMALALAFGSDASGALPASRPEPGLCQEQIPEVLARRGRIGPGAPGDTDGDGLPDAVEILLGTDPGNADSDCDHLDDASEVGVDPTRPLDSDSDRLIDAVESRLVDSNLGGPRDQADATTGWQVSCVRFAPYGVRNDQADASTLEVRIAGGTGATRVRVPEAMSDVLVDGTPLSVLGAIELRDDGTAGDRRAGDGLWSRGGITSNAVTTRAVDRDFHVVEITDASATTTVDLDAVIGGEFDAGRLGVVAAAILEPRAAYACDLQVVSHLVNLVDPLLSLEVRKFLYLDPASLRDITSALYGALPDAYDFIVLFADAPAALGAFGVAYQVQNRVDGIGQAMFDDTSLWGSGGRLQSVVARNFANNGPNLHELGHRFGVYLSPSLGFGQLALGHWGVSGVGRAPLGGFDPITLVDNMNGSYTVGGFAPNGNGGDAQDYSRLDLYLMGLATPFEVPDTIVPVNARNLRCNPGCATMTFDADGLMQVNINDIIGIHGFRIPTSTSSQRDFTGAWVVVSQGRLSEAEMAYFNDQALLFSGSAGRDGLKSFEEATLGRATFDSRVPAPPAGTPLYRSESAVGLADMANLVARPLASPQVDSPPAALVVYYQLDACAGQAPALLYAVSQPSGDLELSW